MNQVPNLVEHNIKNILNYKLKSCHSFKFQYHSLIFNIICFILITMIVGYILFKKYNIHNDKYEKKIKNDKKRDYILYNLRKYQNIKNKYITNIPFE